MRYIIDNDMHIHSKISLCSGDAGQTNERILQYAQENGLKTICLTDHYWDDLIAGASDFYKPQNFTRIAAAKPLPQKEDVKFLFGCETDLDKYMRLGIPKERFDDFDFIIIPTTHMHMMGFTLSEENSSIESRARLWVERFEAVLNMDLPFHKVGIAHLTCPIVYTSREENVKAYDMLKSEDLERLFKKAAKLGCGIEINLAEENFRDSERDSMFRIYKIAKACGCKSYLGSDAHHPVDFEGAKSIFERAIDILELTEEDKFFL